MNKQNRVRKKAEILAYLSIIVGLMMITTQASAILSSPEHIHLSKQTTIMVPEDYSSIQDAIDNASIGTTILVNKGEYKENIVINKEMITIVGSGTSNTIITGDQTSDVVAIYGDCSVITGFTIQNSGESNAGIRIFAEATTVNRSVIQKNGFGIVVDDSSANIITNNIVKENSQAGFWSYRSHANIIQGNTFEQNNYGMLVNFSCFGNNVIGNVLVDNTNTGIQLSESSKTNSFIGNLFSLNTEYGIEAIGSSENNIFHHNDFHQNGQNAVDTATNYWDDGMSEGNYWNDYSGSDMDGDGIGDTPYTIPDKQLTVKTLEGNVDNYPLMNSNLPPGLSIEILNEEQASPNRPIEFHISYEQIAKTLSTSLSEHVICQIDWDDQTAYEETIVDENGIDVNHLWDEEGTYSIKVRSYRTIAGHRIYGEWSTISLELFSDPSSGFFLFPTVNLNPIENEGMLKCQVTLSGIGVFKPNLLIESKHWIHYEDEVVSKQELHPIQSALFFIWFNKEICEFSYPDATECDISVYLYVNGEQITSKTIQLS